MKQLLLNKKRPTLNVCYDTTLQYNKHFKPFILCNIIVYSFSYSFHCIMSYFLIIMVKK